MNRFSQFAAIAGPCLRWIWKFCVRINDELSRTRAFVIAAALAFYFLLALVPLLIVLSSLLGYLALPNAFGQFLAIIQTLIPPDAMAIVERALAGIRAAPHGKLISLGLLGYIWAASGGFSATIEALDIAYDVKIHRPWWRDRFQALLLTFTTGMLTTISLMALMAGPWFGHFVKELFQLPKSFDVIWPVARVMITFVTFMLAVELLYFLGPNTTHSFRSTLPGAVIAVVGWFTGSLGLNLYLTHMTNYSSAYGSLGAVIGLMLWFYLVALSMLVGAEVNAELIKTNFRAPWRRQPEGESERTRHVA